jgi:PIN domain nuclease of toxin-antitoxin system
MVETPCLLDTSTMLLALASPDRLSTRARKAIRSRPLILSVVTYWEVVIKSRKGLLQMADPVTWWERATQALAGTILSIRAGHVSALSGLPAFHKDPFDRMLLAQAAAEGLTLVTSDSNMRRYPVETLW